MENEMEEINKETRDEFMLVTTQAVSLMKGYGDFLDDRINKSWNILSEIFLLREHMRNSGKIISMCKLQQLHLKEIAKLHNESAEDWRKLNENVYPK